ncbi:hypothetical protein [Ferviditalea candida]|uniref:Uncharacterized protein n=1 Tax=Ferviditalea candida TaxID=3108399 RepID=A0ABU5ZMT4_9BACL|nr:hypothetical protein [Paenibacillaceae bacterium T2]
MSRNPIKKNMNAEAETSSSFIFTTEIMIQANTNGLALEKLLHALNAAEIADYRIVTGIEIGKQLEQTKQQAQMIKKIDPLIPGKLKTNSPPNAAGPNKNNADTNDISVQIQYYKEQGTLVRLFVVKGQGIRLSIPCRILNFDAATNNISVYHVDEKQTYLFKLNEIDDIIGN